MRKWEKRRIFVEKIGEMWKKKYEDLKRQKGRKVSWIPLDIFRYKNVCNSHKKSRASASKEKENHNSYINFSSCLDNENLCTSWTVKSVMNFMLSTLFLSIEWLMAGLLLLLLMRLFSHFFFVINGTIFTRAYDLLL